MQKGELRIYTTHLKFSRQYIPGGCNAHDVCLDWIEKKYDGNLQVYHPRCVLYK